MDETLLPPIACDGQQKLRTYRIRWWLLILASVLAGAQGGIWVNYGVIAQAVKPLYGWDDGTIALLANWGPIMYVVAAWPTSYLLDVRGPRSACIAGASLVFAGGLARAVRHSTDGPGAALAHIGQILNALAGPVAMSVGPVLSAMWFPPSERNTATAVISTANYGGCALIFWLGSVCVPPGFPPAQTRDWLFNLMLGECIFTGTLFVLCVFTFQARPASAPSRSATVARESPLAGGKLLVRSRSFWLLALSYGAGSGVFQGWGSLLGPNMQGILPAAEAEAQAGLLGCLGAVAGIVGGIGLGVVADHGRTTPGRRKALLVGACALSCACFAVFAMACSPSLLPKPWVHATSARLAIMYATSITGSMAINAAIPLYFELAVEATYPIAEGMTTTALTLQQNGWAALFLLTPMIPGLGTKWMNWALVGACAVAMMAVLPLEEPRRRLAVDGSDAVGVADASHVQNEDGAPTIAVPASAPPPGEAGGECRES